MTQPRITRFEPMGPAGKGLEEWDPIDPKDLLAGEPVQRGHVYYEDADTGLTAGVWDCTPMTGKMEPYAVNEYMHVLEGSVTMVHEDGHEETIRAGESFVVPKGTVCSWKQTEYMRKFFVIFDDPSGIVASDPVKLRVIRPHAAGPAEGLAESEIADSSIFLSGVPTQHEHTYFEDPTGQMIVGLWESTPFERAVAPFNRCELMVLLDGGMTLTDGDGVGHDFRAGDAVFVPEGAPCGWRSTEDVRKFYCIFMKRQTGAAASDAAE